MFLLKKNMYKLKDKKVLITGGTGLVGMNLTRRLKSLNADVLSSYYSKKNFSSVEGYKYFDFTDFSECIKATEGMDYVIVCAAKIFGSRMANCNPSSGLIDNIAINAGLLEACKLNKVKKIVLMSSSTVYQETNLPIREEQLDLNKSPANIYLGVGWLNRYIEQLAQFYYVKYDMQIGVLRPSSIYGPYDKFDSENSNVLPALIKRALNREDPFVVWGDGSAVRDFIYIDDFIDDVVDVLNNYCVCDPVNSGSGKGISIKDAVSVVLKTCGHNAKIEYNSLKPGSLPYRVLDISKINSIFGNRKRTKLGDGIEKTVLWYQAREDKALI